MAAPTYPLSLPSAPAFQTAKWGLNRRIGVSESPFTGNTQTYEYDYALWSATLKLPQMKRGQAAAWEAFLMKLHGQRGTFLLGNPDASSPRGDISGAVTLASNASVGDFTISLSTTLNSQVNIFRAGDYIQLGTAGTSKLYVIVDDATSDSSGDVDVNVEPAIKTAASSGDTVVYSNPKGVFRMSTSELGWDTDEVSTYGISFSCMEAL